jgi:hypothetical protein
VVFIVGPSPLAKGPGVDADDAISSASDFFCRKKFFTSKLAIARGAIPSKAFEGVALLKVTALGAADITKTGSLTRFFPASARSESIELAGPSARRDLYLAELPWGTDNPRFLAHAKTRSRVEEAWHIRARHSRPM